MTQTFYVTVCLFFYIHQKISKVRIKKRFGKIFLSNPHEVTILNQKRKDIFMRKKQKIKKKKQSQRAYKGFISIVNWYKNKFDVISHISNIYGNEGKKEVIVYRLPLWRDITLVQKLAYFFYFMAETQPFENIKPFTLDLSKSFRNRYKKLTYKNLKAVIIKKIYGNLDYILKSSNKPMMSFILENKTKDNVLDIFKSRFTVPFNIEVPNMEDVVLNNELPEFKFEYRDLETDEKVPIARKNLEKILSQGEKRALYLLNIINDLEAIKQQNKSVLIITDDIAESFDYKNKYAILEYIQDLASDENLNFIILTHNFDFFRTCSARMREMINPRMVSREKGALKIENPRYVFKNPFSEIKKGIYKNNDNDIITAIPFIRNLIEYANSMEDENYKKLTSLLHIKKDTLNITVKDLENIFEKSVTFSEKLNFSNGREDEKVYDLIVKTAKNIVKSGESSIDLDGKIILSMAIRLLAERFMINEITVVDKSGNVLEEVYKQNNQTGKLLGQYKKLCSEQHDNILLMNKVSLMSSENIHINSFMFEPIIDMSIKSLVDLFGRVSLLVD